jgi:hypothetical protein
MRETPLSAADVRAAAEVHRELGPDYSDAVVESFLARIDEHIEARVEQRTGRVQTRRRRPADPARLSKRRTVYAAFVAGSVVAGIPATVLGYRAGGVYDPHVLVWLWVLVLAVFALAGYALLRRRD